MTVHLSRLWKVRTGYTSEVYMGDMGEKCSFEQHLLTLDVCVQLATQIGFILYCFTWWKNIIWNLDLVVAPTKMVQSNSSRCARHSAFSLGCWCFWSDCRWLEINQSHAIFLFNMQDPKIFSCCSSFTITHKIMWSWHGWQSMKRISKTLQLRKQRFWRRPKCCLR